MRLSNTTQAGAPFAMPALQQDALTRVRTSPWWSYGAAVGGVLLILALRLALEPLIPQRLPFLLFVLAVIVPAWIGGWRPGVFAALFAAVVSNYVFVGVRFAFNPLSLGDLLAVAMFLLEGVLLSVMISALRTSQQRTLAANQGLLVSQQHLAFLNEASATLAASLDYPTTLSNLAHAVVPALANWCTIDMRQDDGTIERLALVHADPAKIALAEAFQRRYPPNPNASQGVAQVLRDGKTVYVPHISDAMLAANTIDETQLAMLRELQLRSYIVAPLAIHDRVLGALTLVSSDPARPYTHDDVAFVEDLARRAALAVDNAHLFHQGQQLNAELEQRVEARTAELEVALRDARVFSAKLETSNRELEEFASVASHDLQEPLRKVQAFGDRLKTKAGPSLSPEGRDYLERMQSAAGRMQTLINDLLTFSRVTSKGQPFVAVNLATIAREVESDLETRIEQTGGQIAIGALPVIDADPLQMRQLFQNLLGNALKFHRVDVPPVIQIASSTVCQHNAATETEQPFCQITIADNGIGFDEKYLDRIFNVFQRLHARSEYEGTGVGLAVCRRIAERHGGMITATSKEGQGSTFIMTLPIVQRGGDSSV